MGPGRPHPVFALLCMLSTPRGLAVSGCLSPQNIHKHGCTVFVTYRQSGKMVLVEELENSELAIPGLPERIVKS